MRCIDLTYRHPGPSSFRLGPINLEGPDDRPWLVLGKSGAGKTTFLKLLAGVLHPATGGVSAGDRPEVAYLPQLPERALAGRNLAEDLCGEVRPAPSTRSTLRAALRQAGLEGVPLSRRSRDLSLGERRRLALALLLHANWAGWALDEPDAGLDLPGTQGLLGVLRAHPPAPGAPRWIATARFELYAPLGPWVVVLEGGRVKATGELRDLVRSPEGREALGGKGRAALQVWEGIETVRRWGGAGETAARVEGLLGEKLGLR